jgi:hypothetical protein
MSIENHHKVERSSAVQYVNRLLLSLARSAPSSVVLDESESLPPCGGEDSEAPVEVATSAEVLDRLRDVAGLRADVLQNSRGVISTRIGGRIYMVRAEFSREKGRSQCKLDVTETFSCH